MPRSSDRGRRMGGQRFRRESETLSPHQSARRQWAPRIQLPPQEGEAEYRAGTAATKRLSSAKHPRSRPMNTSEAVLRELVDCGVEACFANPGTSEMHLVASFDRVGGLRPILGLFEGVCTGAADGYARMK